MVKSKIIMMTPVADAHWVIQSEETQLRDEGSLMVSEIKGSAAHGRLKTDSKPASAAIALCQITVTFPDDQHHRPLANTNYTACYRCLRFTGVF